MTVSLTVSVLSLLLLYAYAYSVNPRDARIADIRSGDVGSLVRIQGLVRKVEILGAGGIKIELLDDLDFASISVYIPAKLARSIDSLEEIIPGAKLSVAGEVQEFNGELEVAISDTSMVKLLAGARDNKIELWTLSSNAATFDGMHVQVTGRIGELETIIDYGKKFIHAGGDSFWIDDGGRHMISGKVDVLGEVFFNERRGRFEIKVAGDNDGIAFHPIAIPEGYSVVDLRTLTLAPDDWVSRFVAVLDVEIISGEEIGTSFTMSDVSYGGTNYISCMIFGWSWADDGRDISDGIPVKFSGIWGYYEREAQWQIASDEFTLDPWI